MTDGADAPAGWRCFPGEDPPDEVILGWRMLLALPPAALRNLWALIAALLDNQESAETRQLFEGYAARFDANPNHVLGAARACEILLRQAASLGVDEAGFRADLEALSGGNAVGLELLLPRYAQTLDRLRAQLLERTLADHGNVLVAFDWRVDRVQVSNHGEMDGVTVVFLNLKYRHGDEQKQIALQLPPAAVAVFKEFWSRFSSG